MSKKRKRAKSSQPDLRFGVGDLSGFTAAGVAGFHDLNPAAIVRELLQNSLDAAREAERDLAIVRFEVEKHNMDLVPGIKTYRSVFRQAVADQKKLLKGELPDQATGIVQAISNCTELNECTTLFVLDNGIGLNKDRMKGLLADGLSVKGNEGTGAVGNGHLTIIPASDLRYVLYGGRTEQGGIIGSGHAILASHEQDGRRKSKDGFYVKDIKDDLFDHHVFPEDNEVPDYVKSKLEWIASKWKPGAGTVVAVPGFNRFRENGKSLWELVSRAAACNFFAAFAKEELRIEFAENGDEKILSEANIASTLKQFSTQKRTRNKFPSGSRAWTAFETMRHGEDICVDTDIGRISMRWRLLHQGGGSRVELCRNGMWVTDDLPKLRRNRFTEFKPFHCIILLNACDGEIHRLVRKAEGPLHNHLEAKKWLSDKEREKLDKAMTVVFSKIKEVVPTYDNEVFPISDVMAITSQGILSGGRRAGLAGQFQEIQRSPRFQSIPDQQDAEGGQGPVGPGNNGQGGGINKNKGGRGTFRRAGKAIQFGALSVPVDKRSCRVDLTIDEKTAGSEVRFTLDENLDESCDPFGTESFVRLKIAKINGEIVPKDMFTCNEEGHALGIKLGALHPKKMIEIEFDYELPPSVNLADDVPIVLKTQLIRRAAGLENRE